MAITHLGNQSVIDRLPIYSADEPQVVEDYETVPLSALGQRVTVYITNGTDPVSTSFTEIESTWFKCHSDKAPSWVESDDEVLGILLSKHYGCPIGRPEGWQEGDIPAHEELPVEED